MRSRPQSIVINFNAANVRRLFVTSKFFRKKNNKILVLSMILFIFAASKSINKAMNKSIKSVSFISVFLQKDLVKIVFAILMALTFSSHNAYSQSKSKFNEAVSKGWKYAYGYEYEDRVEGEKKRDRWKEKARELGFEVHYFGVSTVYVYRPSEKAQLDHEIETRAYRLEYSNIKGNDNDLPPADDLTFVLGTAYIYVAIDFHNWQRNICTREFKKISDIRWTGKTSDGLLEGDGLGFVTVPTDEGKFRFLFQGTFHKGFMTKGYFDRGNLSYKVELGPYSEGVAWMKDNTYNKNGDRDGFKYSLIDTEGHILIPRTFSAIKQNFKDGLSIVTYNGTDIVIDKKGAFVKIADGVKEITQDVFGRYSKYRELKTISLPNTITKINKNAFLSNTIESITIPSSVTEIGESAFCDCRQLESVTIPESLISNIKGKAIFKDCPKLKGVYVVSASGQKTLDDSWYWKQSKDPDEDIRRYELAAKSSGEGLIAEDFFTIITKKNMQDIRAFLEARNFHFGESKKSDWYESVGDIVDWTFGYKMEWDSGTMKWLRRSASDFILFIVSYDNQKKRVQGITCHFPYTTLKDAFMKTAPQKQYPIEKGLTFESRTTFMNKDKDKFCVYVEDNGTYVVEFVKDLGIFMSFEEAEKRIRLRNNK